MRVSVIGAGYVGLVSGVCLAEAGHRVTCVDVDAAKVAAIASGDPPIHEPGLAEMMRRAVDAGRLDATADLDTAMAHTELSMIAVGTPSDGDRIDLRHVRAAATAVGAALAGKRDRHTVVVKSTVVPGTTEEVVGPVVERASGKAIGEGFGLGMNPEFLREGEAVGDFMRPDRVVLGGVDDASRDAMAALYAPFPDAAVIRTTPRTAETIKYAANALLATLISFSNEVGNLCAATPGVDVVEVMRGVHLDRRLSPTLPGGGRVSPGVLSYLAAGCGFGGSCFPKDVRALAAYAGERGTPTPLLDAVLAVNDAQPRRIVAMLDRGLGGLARRRVAVLGLAFKPGTDDVRESPALVVIRALADAGAAVVAFDPVAEAPARAALNGCPVRYAASVADAVTGAEAVAVMTAWPEFGGLPGLLAGLADPPLVIDGRRVIDPAAVPRYAGIGVGP